MNYSISGLIKYKNFVPLSHFEKENDKFVVPLIQTLVDFDYSEYIKGDCKFNKNTALVCLWETTLEINDNVIYLDKGDVVVLKYKALTYKMNIDKNVLCFSSK